MIREGSEMRRLQGEGFGQNLVTEVRPQRAKASHVDLHAQERFQVGPDSQDLERPTLRGELDKEVDVAAGPLVAPSDGPKQGDRPGSPLGSANFSALSTETFGWSTPTRTGAYRHETKTCRWAECPFCNEPALSSPRCEDTGNGVPIDPCQGLSHHAGRYQVLREVLAAHEGPASGPHQAHQTPSE